MDDNPDSASTYAKIASWIDQCKTHPKCQWSGRDVMAGRLICVGPSDGSREPYLIDSEDTPRKYVALSYCWGSTKPLVTTVENLNAHKRSIPMQMLPRTVRDAISITRRLGVEFLWVDALCIVQDSKDAEDWQLESSKMDAIYKNAFFTIAAESSPDCNYGILHQRPGKQLHPYKVPFFRPDGEECGSVYICPSDMLVGEDTPNTDGCLITRGWTYQERKLSRRVLSYFSNNVNFACKSGSAEEGAPSSLGPRFSDVFVGKMFPSQQSANSSESVFDSWYKGIEDYSCRNLTYANDRLPAVSGLAHEMHSQVGGEYYAGLWERDLMVGLLWSTIPGQGSGEESTKRSPSWSWAAIDRPVRYGGVLNLTAKWRDPKFHCASDLKAQVTPSTRDPMGRVSGGQLTVEGRVKEVRWKRPPGHVESALPPRPRNLNDGGPNMENSHFWGSSTVSDPAIEAEEVIEKFRSFDPEIAMWDNIFAIAGQQLDTVIQPTGGRPGTSPAASIPSDAGGSAIIPSVIISWAVEDVEDSAMTATKYRLVGSCTFDVETDRPERLWCLSLLADMGLVLERLSDEGTFRRVGFYKSNGPWWFHDVPCEKITIV